ncbi:MAG: hypothetical protein LBC04_01750, partial [Holosporaceae bacterium]|nr:hypothetical protein [Holosporaceae bacterium]
MGDKILPDVLEGGIKVTKFPDNDYVTYVTGTFSVAPIMRIASQYVKISLQLEESTYFFVCKDNTTCDVIRFNIT